jgi:predicted XRE-type DNA-binding protein
MGIQSTGNVFLDLGFSPAESQTLLIKSQLMHTIKRFIEDQQLSLPEAAKLMAVSKTGLRHIVQGKINQVTLEELIGILVQAGLNVKVSVTGLNS